MSPHIRPGLEPPRLQQAAFDDCVYAVDVMRNVAVKQAPHHNCTTGGGSGDVLKASSPEESERKFSLPTRMLCQTSAVLEKSDADCSQAVAGRLEIRMLDKEQEVNDCALYLTAHAQSSQVVVDASATYHSLVPAEEVMTDDETFRTAHGGVSTAVAATAADTERLEVIADDDEADPESREDSFKSPMHKSPVRNVVKSPQRRRKGTTVAPQLGDACDAAAESGSRLANYEILSERLDEERRKISVINLNDLSAAFEASSRLRSPRHSPPPPPPLDQRRYSQEERNQASRYVTGYLSHLCSPPEDEDGEDKKEKGEIDEKEEELAAGRRKRQGVEKYVSDTSQLNLQFERRRSNRLSSDLTSSSLLRPRTADSHHYQQAQQQSYLDSRLRQAAATSPSLASTYEINRVRSSPSLAPSSDRFPFHYTPHVPTGNPPTLRELDARFVLNQLILIIIIYHSTISVYSLLPHLICFSF